MNLRTASLVLALAVSAWACTDTPGTDACVSPCGAADAGPARQDAADTGARDADAAGPDARDQGPAPEDARVDGGPEDAEADSGVDGGPDTGPDAGTADADAGPADTGVQPWCATPPPGFVRVAAGTFVMGAANDQPGSQVSDRPQHPVRLTRDYWIGATEVTQEEWSRLMPNNPSFHTGCARCPVESVSWDEAIDYVNALSTSCGLTPCYPALAADRGVFTVSLDCPGFRLPIDAEWEHATRAGTTTAFFNGEPLASSGGMPEPRMAGYGWTDGSTMTHPVGELMPNPFGLYDVYGNVAEMMSDGPRAYVASMTAVVDPIGPAPMVRRPSLRGGSIGSGSAGLRSYARATLPLVPGDPSFGFRVARTAP